MTAVVVQTNSKDLSAYTLIYATDFAHTQKTKERRFIYQWVENRTSFGFESPLYKAVGAWQ